MSATASHGRNPNASSTSGCNRTTPRRVSAADGDKRTFKVKDGTPPTLAVPDPTPHPQTHPEASGHPLPARTNAPNEGSEAEQQADEAHLPSEGRALGGEASLPCGRRPCFAA
ncbi:hypothetical protein GCM10027271_06470 [Saccharopolyspora gloriosae]